MNTSSISIFSLLFSLILLIVSFIVYQKITKPQLIPVYEDTWWGPAKNNHQIIDKSIKPFKILFTDNEKNDLKNRLKNTRDLIAPLEGTAWTYGISGTFLKNTIIKYWLNDYDFEKRINKLNEFPQYKTNIQGLNIHFIHIKSTNNEKGKKIVPLLMLHGWPGSITEFQKIIPILNKLKNNENIIFEIIAPSLPGFGFSDGAVRPGLGSPQIAVVLKNLMLKLGFDKFYVHGGDWGAIISAQMSSLFPNNVLGMHSSMCTASSLKNTFKTLLYSLAPSYWLDEDYALQMKPIMEQIKDRWIGTGYLHAQATYPDTVGVGPSDSPASLAAIILEKFSFGTNRLNKFKDDGGLLEKFTMDELLDNVMIYWIPNSMTTAMRIYAESLNSQTNSLTIMWPVEVPSACIQFPDEIIYQPSEFLKERFINLIQITRMPTGGHFSSLEEPEIVANDILNFIIKVEKLKK
ncbi:hypothetical protein HCN44_001164 [Aphidius gifuensis]|uniref:Epoxide hydrolase n=1 Tax=Aphidius gifuensis TaxID=684658 RepID=A0A834XPP0_APHGI|nr:juvenile hormone epoxide hydrolase 2-like [Aphidius gifuensis]KAF7988591.1 hypothetical protein HCN44_001164 [Aphidius gifuensis]